MSKPIISIENLAKRYLIRHQHDKGDGLRHVLERVIRSPMQTARIIRDRRAATREWFWALRDINLKITEGEVVGVIGRNGAGKSTLLKLLSRITEPTHGRITISGRIACLLEVGTGFHPELTGRENIFLNGAILGMTQGEIKRKFDEIVAFAEVEKFLDTPSKRYSSGMSVRLAFAVAAHLEPEILVVDEVLAVGDSAFQQKCLGKMSEVSKQGRTIFFVSHNMATVAQLCDRAIWLDGGRVKDDGPAADIIRDYLTSHANQRPSWRNPQPRGEDDEVRINSARILSANDTEIGIVNFDETSKVEITYEAFRTLRDVAIVSRIVDSQGNVIWTAWDSDAEPAIGNTREPGSYTSICHHPEKRLRPGIYRLTVGVMSKSRALVFHESVLSFEVSEIGYSLNPGRLGVIPPPFHWEVHRTRPATLNA